MKLEGRFGSLVFGNGMTAMSAATGSEMKTRMAAKTNIEILAHCFRWMSPMPAARPQPPKPENITASMTTKNSKFAGTLAAGLDFDRKREPSTIIAPPRMVNALPMITTTAETVIPTERGIDHSPLTMACLNNTRNLRNASDCVTCVRGGLTPGFSRVTGHMKIAGLALVRLRLPAQPVDATPSNQLIRQ